MHSSNALRPLAASLQLIASWSQLYSDEMSGSD